MKVEIIFENGDTAEVIDPNNERNRDGLFHPGDTIKITSESIDGDGDYFAKVISCVVPEFVHNVDGAYIHRRFVGVHTPLEVPAFTSVEEAEAWLESLT